jgi:hypothetical protein
VSVVGIILAAGRGARMGRPKQLLPLDGRPLLQHVIDTAVAAPLDGIVVVLGHASDEVAAALASPGSPSLSTRSTTRAVHLAADPPAPPDRPMRRDPAHDQPEVRRTPSARSWRFSARSDAPILRWPTAAGRHRVASPARCGGGHQRGDWARGPHRGVTAG